MKPARSPKIVSRIAWQEQTTWILIPVLTVALAGIAVEFGAPNQEASLTALFLFILPWAVWREGPSKEEYPEYAFLRITRVRLYFWGLIFLIFANGVLVWILPIFALIVIIPIAGVGLRILYETMLVGTRRDLSLRKAEENWFSEMYLSLGGSAINLSLQISMLDLVLYLRTYIEGSFIAIGLFVIISLALAQRALTRERLSRTNAQDLAESLRKRNWWKIFERQRHKG